MKITNVRVLANSLYEGPVAIKNISKGVFKRVELWISRNEAIISNGFLILCK